MTCTAQTVPALLAELAATRPDAIVRTDDAALSGVDLFDQSSELSARLVSMGVRKGSVVALLLPNGTEWVCWWAAIARIGAVVVPMNTFATPVEVGRVLEDSGAHVLVAVPAFARHAYRDELAAVLGPSGPLEDRVSTQLPQLRRVLWTDGVDVVVPIDGTGAVVEALAADVVPADVLTVIYSSGSTGVPKGVVHAHGPTLRQAQRLAALTGTRPSTVLWTSMPLSWVGGLVWAFLRTVVAGGTFVTQARFEPGSALQLFGEAGVDAVTAWVPVIEQLRRHPTFSEAAHSHIAGLQLLPPGPEARPTSLGMTETLGPHSGWFGGADREVPPGAAGSFGRALPGTVHRIVEPGTDVGVREGQPGELLVRGDALMLGLHRRERGDVFTPDGWYATGDGAVLRDGWLFFQGRLDDVIKTAGVNVSPSEVQAVLERHPSIRQAFVVGVPHDVRGEEVTAVVVSPDDHLDVEEVLLSARVELASYKVPRRILVIDEEDIPWLSSQKVDLGRLRAMVAGD
jgi:acyl-CoA synthetase (AMP-forming)/AMP-acid ligase II